MVSRGTTVMDKPLWVPMDAEERKGHVDQLLRHLQRVDELEADLSAYSKRKRSDIADEMKEIQRLRRVLSDDGKQMTLAEAKVGDVEASTQTRTTEEQAVNALASVAKAQDDGAVEFDGDRPTICGKCGGAVKEFLHGVIYDSNACDWIARPKGMKLDGTPLEASADAATTEASAETPSAETDNCIGCGAQLAGVERVKGMCEACQLAKGGDALEDTPEAFPNAVKAEVPCGECGGAEVFEVTDYRTPKPEGGELKPVSVAACANKNCSRYEVFMMPIEAFAMTNAEVIAAGGTVPEKAIGTPEAETTTGEVTYTPESSEQQPQAFTPDTDDADWVDGKTAADASPAEKRKRRIRAKVEGEDMDDVRPKCSKCADVLDADEVEKGIGICQACIDAPEQGATA